VPTDCYSGDEQKSLFALTMSVTHVRTDATTVDAGGPEYSAETGAGLRSDRVRTHSSHLPSDYAASTGSLRSLPAPARRCLLPSNRDEKHADREAVEVVTVVGDVGRPWLSVAALR
jgi:hypothetical protein